MINKRLLLFVVRVNGGITYAALATKIYSLLPAKVAAPMFH